LRIILDEDNNKEKNTLRDFWFYFMINLQVFNVCIENMYNMIHVFCRSKPVQLLSRHWKIFGKDGDLQIEVAPGAKGVVGQTPIIKPNTCFSYYSGTDLDSKGGSMEGSFGMAVLSESEEENFDAMISRFPFQE